MIEFWEIVRRSETGKRMVEKDFDMKCVSEKLNELTQEYNIQYDPNVIITTDDELVDNVWKASLELLAYSGVYHIDARRIIEFTLDEIEEAIKSAPREIILGADKDQVIITPREVEDTKPPVVYAGPTGAPLSNDLFVTINQTYIQEPLINVLFMPGRIEQIEGAKLRVNSALEVQAVRRYCEWTHKAMQLAGRESMPVVSCAAGILSLNEVGASDPEYGLKRADPRVVTFLPELKINDTNLSKAAHYHKYGSPVYSFFDPLIGGWGGNPAGTAVLAAAHHIAALMVFNASIVHFGSHHLKYTNMSNPHSLYTNSLAGQAVSRNAKILRTSASMCAASAPSPQILYETAAIAIASVTSGSDLTGGPRASRTSYENHVSPIVARFYAEMGHAAARLNRTKADEISKELIGKYRDKMTQETAPHGKPFQELYNLNTLEPSAEQVNIYNQVKEELIQLGVPVKL